MFKTMWFVDMVDNEDGNFGVTLLLLRRPMDVDCVVCIGTPFQSKRIRVAPS